MRRFLVGVLASIALQACGGAPVEVAPSGPALVVETTHTTLPSQLEEDPGAPARIKEDITRLASPEFAGRGTGEPGARLAADFVASRFTELHLAPLGDGGDARGYFQAFRARVGAHAEPPQFEWPDTKRSETHVGPEARAADGSASGTATGVPVLVGYGVSAPALGWDDYASAKLEGKIAVVLDGAPNVTLGGRADALHDYRSARYKLRTAREHGAVGVVVIVRGDQVPEASSDASSMGIPGVIVTTAYAEQLLAFRTSTAPKARAEEIHVVGASKRPRSRFDDDKLWSATAPAAAKPIAPKPLAITTKVEPVDADAWNVIAFLPARNDAPTAKENIVVGAHYDHLGHGGTSASRAPGSHDVHPGADDNASGVALMLEVARRLTALPTKLDRGVVFIAFGGEELGVLGSRHFVEHPTVPLASIAAMINADMVGRLRDDKLVIDGTATAKEWPDLLKHAAEGLHFDLALGGEGFGASDHASFTTARVPVAFFFTGVHADYHRPSDTADKINAEGEARVATLAARLARDTANAPVRFAFVEAPPDPHRGMRGGFKVSLGTLPDYAFDGHGVKITGTRPDSPAARGGLRPNDVIVQVGSHAIGNIHDYMFALGDLEAGREVTVVVERDGARTTLKVVPAPPQ